MALKNRGNLGLGKILLAMLRARSRLAQLRQDPEVDDTEDTRSLTDGRNRHEWDPHRGSAALPRTKTHTILFVDAGFV